ncbi:MAG: hypothetical protein II949_07865 [Prevotella sp.]|nr:hypothetical protein [Prevotella sp.]
MAITTYILLAAASLLPALATSVGRCFREKDLLSFSLFSLCVIWEATMISAFFHADYMMALLDMYGQSIRSYHSYICIASLLGCLLVNLMLLLTVKYMKKQHALKWIIGGLALFLFATLIIGICISLVIGVSLDQGFFAACCGVMGAVGVAWGLTYKEICVIGNIYLEAGVCVLSALWLTWSTIKVYRRNRTILHSLLMSAGLLCGMFYLLVFWLICCHYAMPMEKAFDLCYHELLMLASDWNTTYNNVNYLIFIILFLVLTVGNILAAKCLSCNSYKKEGT